ncbi:DEAD/DEAH box helicase [Shouchella oshimensis]|nr:DEAD/DEAH box helicase family protein [Shouchella oshimensis]
MMDTNNYFITSNANILDNEEQLRSIQLKAYTDLCEHFLINQSKEHAVAVLPTGSGKTGLMAIAPFGVSKGRVLIITPQLVIKDHVLESLDPSSPDNFWLKRGVFNDARSLPVVTEYDKETNEEELINSNIVILNIHKVSQGKNSLINKVDSDFFDMIIIDEAHHSPAKSWTDALNYFSDAKVLKVTGTPFRSDRKEIEGKMVVNVRLGYAMREGIVKTLKNFVLKPETVYLTIDGDESKTYTIKELREEGIKDEDFIRRSVALSNGCNKQIVDSSISELKKRTFNSEIPHKIIAVCCSIFHSGKVEQLYNDAGMRTVVIHSKLSKKDKQEALRKVESHQADVVIHVAMLGEGYDHPFLSVAAIFRPYKSLAPYSQFIGRILRKVENPVRPIDDIGSVVAHRDLGLDSLWSEYQKEHEYSSIIDKVKENDREEERLLRKIKTQPKDNQIGEVLTEGTLLTDEEFYEQTLAAKDYENYLEDIRIKAEQLKAIFPHKSDASLKEMAEQEYSPVAFNPLLKNPKKYRETLRKQFSDDVQFNIPAELLVEFQLNKEDNCLKDLKVNKRFKATINKPKLDNAGIISVYLNDVLYAKFGSRGQWKLSDYMHAQEELGRIVKHLKFLIENLKEEYK